jgi:cytoskeletal protein RodZ
VTRLNEVQVKQFQEISTKLQQVRQEKSIRIEEIAAQTLIRPAILLALEEGRYEELPELVFVQGFIRRYADALGLDGSALTQSLESNVFRLDTNCKNQNLDRKSVLHIPLFITYGLLLAAASAGLVYTHNPQVTSESLTPQLNEQQSMVNSNQERIIDN